MDPVILDRAMAYMGVMIDDLVTRGVSEPYRMFTSRAEYRLSLRADNADERLTGLGMDLGLVGPERGQLHQRRMEVLSDARTKVRALGLTSSQAAKLGLKVNQDGIRRSAHDLMAMREIGYAGVCAVWPELQSFPVFVVDALEADALYQGYLQRQDAEIAALRKEEDLRLPSGLPYGAMPSLSAELRQKLLRVQPATLAQASRIDGMTPAALAILLSHVKRQERRETA